MKIEMLDMFDKEIEGFQCYKLPRITPSLTDSDFSNAFAIDMSLNDEGENNKEEIVKMFHGYSGSFWKGCEDAGVNLLRHMTLLKVNAKADDGDTDVLSDRYEALVNSLCEKGNPAGPYYRALMLIFGIVDNGKSDEENLDAGIAKMYEFANEGNPYAEEFVMRVEA